MVDDFSQYDSNLVHRSLVRLVYLFEKHQSILTDQRKHGSRGIERPRLNC